MEEIIKKMPCFDEEKHITKESNLYLGGSSPRNKIESAVRTNENPPRRGI